MPDTFRRDYPFVAYRQAVCVGKPGKTLPEIPPSTSQVVKTAGWIKMNQRKLLRPEDELWSVRRGAVVHINLELSHSRFIHGEAVIETRYTLYDNVEDFDPNSRIWLGHSRREVITQLYEILFDTVLNARAFDVIKVIIHFPGADLGAWERDFLVVVYIVAHELDVPVLGIAEEGLSHPGESLTLSDYLDGLPIDEDDNS